MEDPKWETAGGGRDKKGIRSASFIYAVSSNLIEPFSRHTYNIMNWEMVLDRRPKYPNLQHRRTVIFEMPWQLSSLPARGTRLLA